MTDWATVASLATAGGTLVLAFATFGATRSANRAARTAERAFAARLRPVLVQSRREDPVENLKRLFLPALTLGVYLSATLIRFLRADMIEVMAADYVRTARAKGLRERAVVIRHGLKNALIPVLTIVGLEIGALLGGAVIIEQVFGWSGIGWLVVQAIFNRDYPLVQTTVLFVAVGLTLVNLVVDLGYGLLNPRIRAGYGS